MAKTPAKNYRPKVKPIKFFNGIIGNTCTNFFPASFWSLKVVSEAQEKPIGHTSASASRNRRQ
jgi:hypothetical protein